MLITCPQCRQQIAWDSKNPFRPFCSERCKKIDLGAWAEGNYVIPGTSLDEDAFDGIKNEELH